ncbi:hypothetical protein [Lignipirellula cremea]|uniref:hypothetical protein n=1 Tax=Lignipirellula cremea TaxID=2528010 RepID=UPI0011A488DC|nr:hypothetical protein [Lignipirellula cremea]
MAATVVLAFLSGSRLEVLTYASCSRSFCTHSALLCRCYFCLGLAPRGGLLAENSRAPGMSTYLRTRAADLLRLIESLDREQWIFILVAVTIAGFLMLKGMGGRRI